MNVSMVLTSMNEERYAKQFFDSLEKQTRKADEIVLVDSSTDRTPEIAKPHVDKMIMGPTRNLSHARDIGVRNSTGDIIVLTDIDAILHPSWLEELVKPLENDYSVKIVQGNVLCHGWDDETGMFSRGLHDGMGFVNHCNVAYKRVVLEEFPFDPTLIDMDDSEMGYRVTKKYKIYAARNARVWHIGTQFNERFANRAKLVRLKDIWGMGMAQCFLKYKNPHWFLRPWYHILHSIFKMGRLGHGLYLIKSITMGYYNVGLRKVTEPPPLEKYLRRYG